MTRTILTILGIVLLTGCSNEIEREDPENRDRNLLYYVKTKTGIEVREIVKAELADFQFKQEYKNSQQEKLAKIRAEIQKRIDEANAKNVKYEYFIPLTFKSYGKSQLEYQPKDFPETIYANINYEHGNNTYWGDMIISDFEDFIEDQDTHYSDESKNIKPESAQKAYEIMEELIIVQRCSLWLDLHQAELDYDNEIRLSGTIYMSYGRAGDRKPLRDYLYDNHRSVISPEYREEATLEKYFGHAE